MNNVQFDEQSYTSAPTRHGKKQGVVMKLIISSGLAKDEKQANMVMIGLIIVLCIITFFALRSGLPSSNDDVFDPDEGSLIEP